VQKAKAKKHTAMPRRNVRPRVESPSPEPPADDGDHRGHADLGHPADARARVAARAPPVDAVGAPAGAGVVPGEGGGAPARVASPGPLVAVAAAGDPAGVDSPALLGALAALDEGASWGVIVRAARSVMTEAPDDADQFRHRLLILVHPDRNRDDIERANTVTALINNAWDVFQNRVPVAEEAAPADLDLPCSMRPDTAATVVTHLHRAHQSARASVYAYDEDFAARRARDTQSSDVVVLLYNIERDEWTTRTDVDSNVANGSGVVYLSRVQVLFARCHPDGEGLSATGTESATFAFLKANVLKPIARCYHVVDDVHTVGFLVTNALPTLVYATEEAMRRVSQLHAQFDARSDGSTLGDFSREQVMEAVRAHLTALSLELSGMSPDIVLDIHSAKVSELLDTSRFNIGTLGSHPCAGVRRAPDIPLFVALAAIRHANPIFADLMRVKLFTDVLNRESVLDELKTLRASLEGELRAAANNLPVKESLNEDSGRLFRHQRLAVQGIVERFFSGLPGALLHLDVGFGKTTVMFATTYVMLRTEAVASVTWLLEAFSMRDDRKNVPHRAERVPAVMVAFREFLVSSLGLADAEASTLMSRVRALKSGHQGDTAEKMTGALQAAAATAGDHLVFVDEASRYLGTLRSPSALVRACESITGRVFRVAMTATPLTSALDRVFNVFAVLGASFETEGDRNSARIRAFDCALAVVSDIQHESAPGHGAANGEAETSLPALANLSETLREVTVGHATWASDAQVQAETSDMVHAIGIHRIVHVVPAESSEADLSLCDAMVDALHQPSFAHLVRAKHELHAGLAVSAYASRDAYAAYVERVPQDRISPLSQSIIDTIADARARRRAVIVFFPSDLAAVMHMSYQEIRSCTVDCASIGVVDGDTPDNERATLFADINVDRDRVDSGPKLDVLFMTIETSGYGLNATNVHTLVCVGFPWTDSALSQAMGRVTRACASNTAPGGKLLIHVVPMSSKGGFNMRRFFRSAARGQSFGTFFPAVVHADRPSVQLRHVFERPPQNEAQREAYCEYFGGPLHSLVFTEERVGEEREYAVLSYDDFLRHVNEVIAEIDDTQWGRTDLSFLLTSHFGASEDDNETARDGRDRGGRGRGGGGGRRGGRGGGRRGGRHDSYVPSTPDMRKEAVFAFCRRESARVPALPAETRRTARNTASQLAASLDIAYNAENRQEYTASNAHDHDYWIVFDTSSPLRRQMIFASAFSSLSFRYAKSYFAPAVPPERTESELERIQYGNDHEADAVEHVRKKYDFALVPPDHVKAFTRLHPSVPRVLAGSADAITTCGVLLEIKCIQTKDGFFNKIGNLGRKALDDYVDQVRALLEVYGLPLGLLCYWHGGSEGDAALSFEFPVYRDESWWQDASVTMECAASGQAEALARHNAWVEDIMCPQ